MSKKIVAIVGRPNVGKSTLFNALAGEKISIIRDVPGVTRDRIYADCSWRGTTFQIIDTGGIEPENEDIILKQMRRQAMLAMEMADVIVFITDVKAGVTTDDEEVAQMLRKTKKPVVLVCNKCDRVGEPPAEIYEFYKLGLGEPCAISAGKKLGIGELLDAVYDNFENIVELPDDEETIKVAIIGRPNAGKSSLVNKLLNEERVIVSDIAGTTRDAIDSYLENKYGRYVFIDTAGIRRKSKVYDKLEQYSVVKAKAAIERANVCVLLVDSTEGITEQDEKIAGLAHEAGKGVIICINKWDLIQKETGTLEKYKKNVRAKLAYMDYAPILFISTLTGQRVNNIFELINSVNEANNLRVPTGVLNDVISEAIAITQPPSDKGKRLKIYYITQVTTRPPTFVVFVNNKELMHFSYVRYLENHIRKCFKLEGTPIKMITREKSKKEMGE
ncbi:MAG: ribosome biogenesis GTPase Der [Clostridia bacterium]|nr:ribosome biogenesis GTPase Der [Clostridia bacterium]